MPMSAYQAQDVATSLHTIPQYTTKNQEIKQYFRRNREELPCHLLLYFHFYAIIRKNLTFFGVFLWQKEFYFKAIP